MLPIHQQGVLGAIQTCRTLTIESARWQPGLFCMASHRFLSCFPGCCRRGDIRFKTGFKNTVYDTMLARPGWRETESCVSWCSLFVGFLHVFNAALLAARSIGMLSGLMYTGFVTVSITYGLRTTKYAQFTCPLGVFVVFPHCACSCSRLEGKPLQESFRAHSQRQPRQEH